MDLGPKIAHLLTTFQTNGTGSRRYVDQILAAFASQSDTETKIVLDPRPSATQLIEPLTNRQQEVLVLLAHRLTNKEIAERLVIAPTTVRQHTIHIYQKLAVNGRRQAVSKAISLGIIQR